MIKGYNSNYDKIGRRGVDKNKGFLFQILNKLLYFIKENGTLSKLEF